MRDGRELIGYGMSSGIWEALRVPTSAEVEIAPEGRLVVKTAAADIGTGTYTILAQIGADMLGLPVDSVEVRIGDSDLPACPVEGGSWTAASAGSAVMEACDAIRKQLIKLAATLIRGRELNRRRGFYRRGVTQSKTISAERLVFRLRARGVSRRIGSSRIRRPGGLDGVSRLGRFDRWACVGIARRHARRLV
jgi:CO/xanthine dehydrogenase Mo-binding subunit